MQQSMWKTFKSSMKLPVYRIASVFSDRFADRLREEKWRQDGYFYDYLMEAWILQTTNAIYLPVAKSANTTMKHILQMDEPSEGFLTELQNTEKYQNYKRQYAGDMLPEHDMLIRSYTPNSVILLKDSGLIPDDLMLGTRRCFTVVRHPVKRFLSTWQNKTAQSEDTTLKHALRVFFGREEGTSFSVDDLISYVSETPLQDMDVHVLPQWASCGAGRIPFEMVGKVENLRQDVEAFAGAGLIPKESVNRLRVRNTSGRVFGGASRSDSHSLTQAQISTITAIYERDFEMFDY